VSNARTSEDQHDQAAIRVLVADDEETVVDVLRALVGSDPRLRFVGSANDAEQAIELVMSEKPDVVLLDVRMPGGGGLRAAREITKRFPPARIVALSAHEDADTVIGMIGAGARAYVPKADSTEKILRTIHRAVGESRPSKGTPPRLKLVEPPPPQRDERAAWVARAILDGAVTAAFEPIVDIDTGQTLGLDVQPRVATLPHRSYDAWCADAQAVGLLIDLELAAFRAGRLALRHLPEEAFLEFEVSPFTASSARFRRTIQGTVAARISLGFSPLVAGGGVAINDVNFGETLEALRNRGVRVSARDAGSGLSALGHLTSLAPDFVRLDQTLTRSVEHSFSNHSIVAAVAACAGQIGASVIAAGVTSEGQLDELRRLGVHMVQGTLVGEPIHLSELPSFVERWVKSTSEKADDLEGKPSSRSTSNPGGDTS
jgi:EAL domain-containing protein (putative c-di-GMP-specific phosphodiesterase class I)/DNA-binding NarL/FixJ family response regulator